ncbi:hypothetical protein ACYZUD_04425 [Pseudomonas sp. XS1P51]
MASGLFSPTKGILGRFHDATGHNFSRSFDQSAAMALPSANVQQWQKSLMQLAATADVMLDPN